MVVTKEFIESGASDSGGWSKAQLACLGISWPPKQGWKSQLIGVSISDESSRRFLDLKKSTGEITVKNSGWYPRKIDHFHFGVPVYVDELRGGKICQKCED